MNGRMSVGSGFFDFSKSVFLVNHHVIPKIFEPDIFICNRKTVGFYTEKNFTLAKIFDRKFRAQKFSHIENNVFRAMDFQKNQKSERRSSSFGNFRVETFKNTFLALVTLHKIHDIKSVIEFLWK